MKRQHIPPITVFYSYAHEDEKLRSQLERHLSLLEREGLIRPWYDQKISAGTERSLAIRQALNESTLILLLISSHFIASHRCYEIEMIYALQRHRCGKAHVIPIILRPCDWQIAPFAALECLPQRGKAVTEWKNQDAAFREIAWCIRWTLNTPLQTEKRLWHYFRFFLRLRMQFNLRSLALSK